MDLLRLGSTLDVRVPSYTPFPQLGFLSLWIIASSPPLLELSPNFRSALLTGVCITISSL